MTDAMWVGHSAAYSADSLVVEKAGMMEIAKVVMSAACLVFLKVEMMVYKVAVSLVELSVIALAA